MSNSGELIKNLLEQASEILEELKNLDNDKEDINTKECDCKCDDNFCNEECSKCQNTYFDRECITIPLKDYIELIEIRGKYLELKNIKSKESYSNNDDNFTLDKYKTTSKDTLTDPSLVLSWVNKNIPTIY